MRSGKHLGRTRRFLRLRHAIARPIYTLSMVLDFTSVALGRLATWIAGDDPAYPILVGNADGAPG
jgi:hypothetical protein